MITTTSKFKQCAHSFIAMIMLFFFHHKGADAISDVWTMETGTKRYGAHRDSMLATKWFWLLEFWTILRQFRSRKSKKMNSMAYVPYSIDIMLTVCNWHSCLESGALIGNVLLQKPSSEGFWKPIIASTLHSCYWTCYDLHALPWEHYGDTA